MCHEQAFFGSDPHDLGSAWAFESHGTLADCVASLVRASYRLDGSFEGMSVIHQSSGSYMSFFGKTLLAVALAGACLTVGATIIISPARADPPAAQDVGGTGNCDADIGNIQKKRMGIIQELNKLAAAGKGKIDPIASCPKLRALSAAEGQLKAYMTKNKSWCNIPDEILAQVSGGAEKTTEMSARACEIATQIRKQQQGAAQADAPPAGIRLPTGPL